MGGPDGGVQTTAEDLVRLLDGLRSRGEPFAGFFPRRRGRSWIGPYVAGDDGVFGSAGASCTWEERRALRTGEDPGASARA
jgi:hypothetical protein